MSSLSFNNYQLTGIGNRGILKSEEESLMKAKWIEKERKKEKRCLKKLIHYSIETSKLKQPKKRTRKFMSKNPVLETFKILIKVFLHHPKMKKTNQYQDIS